MSLTRTYPNEFFTTVASNHMEHTISQQFRPNDLVDMFLSKKKSVNGGLQVEIPFDIQEHSNTKQVTTGYEAADTAVQTILTSGSDQWAFWLRPVIVSWIDDAKVTGPGKLIDLTQTRTENTVLSTRQEMERRLLRFSAIAQMSDINTLNGDDEAGGFFENTAVGSQNNTVHGISKSTYGSFPGFQNQRYDAAGDASANALPGLRSLINRIRQRTRAQKDLRGYLSFSFAEHYGTVVQGQERYTEASSRQADAIGGETIIIGGIPTTQTPNMPNAGSTTGAGNDEWSALFVDHRCVQMQILGNGKLDGSMEPFHAFGAGHSTKIAFFKFGGQLCIGDWGSSGILFGGDTY